MQKRSSALHLLRRFRASDRDKLSTFSNAGTRITLSQFPEDLSATAIVLTGKHHFISTTGFACNHVTAIRIFLAGRTYNIRRCGYRGYPHAHIHRYCGRCRHHYSIARHHTRSPEICLTNLDCCLQGCNTDICCLIFRCQLQCICC